MNKAGFLPSTGVVLSLGLKRYDEPLRLPFRAAVISLALYTLVGVLPTPKTGLQHWAIRLPEHAVLATPGVDGCHFRYSSTLPAAFPF